jgi:potassium-transporting ATPase KdpC subunit
MKKSILISIRLLFLLTLITGIVYPLLITGIAQVFFHNKAEGSLIKKDGVIIGSELIGQEFNSATYFRSRPSAVSYQTLPSGGSNLSWSDKRLNDLVTERKAAFLRENMLNDTTAIPVEMLFASASGLDPHISPRAAFLQVERISQARGFSEDQKQKLITLVTKKTEKPQYSLFGEVRINVFLLNLELDKIK